MRCRVEKPADSNPSTQRRSDSSVLSIFNFTSSSQDSGSSTPPRAKGGAEWKKQKIKRKKRKCIVRKRVQGTRNRSKEKKMRLEAVNQQWGIGKDDALEDEEDSVKQKELRSSKKVSFRCPSSSADQEEEEEGPQDEKNVLSPTRRRSILKDRTEKTPEHSQALTEIQHHPCSSLKRSKPQAGSPQSTPKRPRLSPGQRARRRSSGPSPNTSLSSRIAERSVKERKEKESPRSSPGTGRSQTSPAHTKRNHKGETPLHLAAIKVCGLIFWLGFFKYTVSLVVWDPSMCPQEPGNV